MEENLKSRKIREAQENSEKIEAEKVERENEEAAEGEAAEAKTTTESASTSSPLRSSASSALPSPMPTSGPQGEWPPFMTIPILSGLMVTSILLGILGFAISAMMEIKPMLRFDDPKGKSLQFAVQD